MVKGKLIEFDEQQFRELCDKGLSFEEIGRQFGAKATWACKKAKALGIKKERKSVKVTWNLTPNSTPEYLEDGVSRLVRKRNGILLRFLETGDLSEARAYCAKYGVPRPDGDEAFRMYVQSAAARMKARGSIVGHVARPPKGGRRGGRQPKFTREQLQEQVDKGLNVVKIAEALGCTKPTIYKRMKEHGIKLKHSGQRTGPKSNTWTRIDRDKLQELCDKGLTINRIAKEMGVGVCIVRRNIKEYGIERKSLRKVLRIDKEQLRKMVEEDRMTYKQIAEVFDCDYHTVGVWARKYGFKKPKKEDIRIEEDDLQQVHEVSMVPRTVKRMPVRRLQRRKRRGGKRA